MLFCKLPKLFPCCLKSSFWSWLNKNSEIVISSKPWQRKLWAWSLLPAAEALAGQLRPGSFGKTCLAKPVPEAHTHRTHCTDTDRKILDIPCDNVLPATKQWVWPLPALKSSPWMHYAALWASVLHLRAGKKELQSVRIIHKDSYLDEFTLNASFPESLSPS